MMKTKGKMMKKSFFKKKIALTALFSLLVSASQVMAYNSPVDRSRDDYSSGMTRKLGRGVANAGLGWGELFKGVSDVNQENGFLAGATWGPIYGTLNAVKRTAVGVYEAATFPIAGPEKFEPILEPEFVLEDQS